MTAPKSIHQGMLGLLLGDLRLAVELAHAAAGVLDRPIPDDIRDRSGSFELVRLFDGDEPYKLFPDLVITLHDENGKLIGVWIIENQIRGVEGKKWRLPAYRAAVQLHFEHTADMLACSPSPAGRRWLHDLDEVLHDPPTVLDLEVVTRVCNPAASWLVDERASAPEQTDEQLEKELVIARARPHAALFHAVHHARDLRAFQVVLAALLASRDLGPELCRRYTVMVLDSASKAMKQALQTELSRRYPEDEISAWEREGAGFQDGRVEGLELGKREAIFDILELRGLSLDPALREQIDTCTDLAQLERWRQLAKRVPSIEDLFG